MTPAPHRLDRPEIAEALDAAAEARRDGDSERHRHEISRARRLREEGDT